MDKVKTITLRIVERPPRVHVVYDGTFTMPCGTKREALNQIADDRKSGIIEENAPVEVKD